MPTALMFMLLTAPTEDAVELPRLMVVDLKVEEGVSESAVRLLNELLLTKVMATQRYEVFGEADIRSILDLEKEKQLSDCSDVSCVAMVAGALGAERTLFGSVGAIGELYVLNLRLVNNKDVKVEARWSETFEGEEKELVAAVDRAVASLIPVEAATVVEEEDRFYQTWWFWTLVGVGVAGTTAGVVAATSSDKNGVDGPMVRTQVSVELP